MEKDKVESRTEMWAKGTGSWLGTRHQKGEKCFAQNYGFRACNGSGQLDAGYDEAEEQMTCIFFDRRAARPSVPQQGQADGYSEGFDLEDIRQLVDANFDALKSNAFGLKVLRLASAYERLQDYHLDSRWYHTCLCPARTSYPRLER